MIGLATMPSISYTRHQFPPAIIRHDKFVERAASTFKPSKDAGASGLEKLELNGAAGLPLDNDRSGANRPPLTRSPS